MNGSSTLAHYGGWPVATTAYAALDEISAGSQGATASP
jgi:hypothetical protein